ncbi:MAG: UDP-N-acetylmuramate--L-alanine ligase [Gemmatimonadota bacterium]
MKLFLPSNPQPLHFVGIGGAGMSALALIALRRGLRVTGSDADIRGAGDLILAGATVVQGEAPELAGAARAVVASAAIPSHNADLVRARERGVPVIPRKEALAALIGSARSVAIAGTHGKTTTTVMTTVALTAAGLSPTGIAGGRVGAWGGNALIASDELFVVEADEYDQAFLTLQPTVAVINNVEADHLECYGSIEALESAFVTFAARAERALVGNDGPGSDRVAARLDPTRVWRFGPGARDLAIAPIAVSAAGSRAPVRLPGGRKLTIALRVPGEHNVRNAVAAFGAVEALGGDVDRALEALAAFEGVGRRFDRLGEIGGVTVVDDYAHHPTELKATLRAARQAFPDRKLVAAFQPHLYSRTALHWEAMGEALAAADLVIVAGVYGAREAPVPGVTGALVAEAASRLGTETVYEPDRSALGALVAALVHPGDVLLTLGAGDITNLADELGKAMAG